MKPIYEYLNYRDFLRDYYVEKKSEHSFYSYRLFSEKAGFKSPNFPKLVIDGRRNLSKDSVFRFCKALRLKKKESEFFENLVFFNQSKTLEEKNYYLAAVMKHRGVASPDRIEKSEFAYYSSWYHPVIRELVCAVDFGDDYSGLAQAVIPALSAGEAEKSVKLLLDLGFIRRLESGKYEKTSASLSTGRQVKSVAVANYHKEMMKLASESIERFSSSQRDVESVTVSVSEETYKTIMGKAHEFLIEMLSLAEADKKNECVSQVNVQVFPLSRRMNSERPGGEKRQ